MTGACTASRETTCCSGGPGKTHSLDDALRCWLTEHPDDAAALAVNGPQGPLDITYRTGRRGETPGIGGRFDSIWVSHHWRVRHIEHLYDNGIAAGSDHALVVADIDLMSAPCPHPDRGD
jgi:endonuclease/exonuclease/phosphatase family metal-dependent hydrolase